MTSNLDPRIHAFRPDLADGRLRNKVQADRYVEGTEWQVRAPFVSLRAAPDRAAMLHTQLLTGESVSLFDEQDGWAWVQNQADGYVGYLPVDDLRPDLQRPTHKVGALRTFLYAEPDIKSRALDMFHFGAKLRVDGQQRNFVQVGNGWVFVDHLMVLRAAEDDYVTTAYQFVGSPYLWGGRTSLGLDCSALVQLCLQQAGVDCPRDSDQQQQRLGELVTTDADASYAFKRGDIVFFPGHVGIMLDGEQLLHANAHHMLCVHEPIGDVLERNRRSDDSFRITAVKRIPSLATIVAGEEPPAATPVSASASFAEMGGAVEADIPELPIAGRMV